MLIIFCLFSNCNLLIVLFAKNVVFSVDLSLKFVYLLNNSLWLHLIILIVIDFRSSVLQLCL
jgi:hypothetical protein